MIRRLKNIREEVYNSNLNHLTKMPLIFMLDEILNKYPQATVNVFDGRIFKQMPEPGVENEKVNLV